MCNPLRPKIMFSSVVNDKQFILGFSFGVVFSLVLAVWKRSKSCQTSIEDSIRVSKKRRKNTEQKMVLVVRKDAKLTKRELAVHCVNASVEAFKRSLVTNPDLVKQWQRWGQMKVAVKVKSEAELLEVKNETDKNGLVSYLVRDSDKSKQNALVLAIGPDSIEDINVVTGHLKLL